MRLWLTHLCYKYLYSGSIFLKPFLFASASVLSVFNFKIWIGVLSNLVLCGGVTEVGSLNGCSPFLASDEDSWSDGEQEPITVD